MIPDVIRLCGGIEHRPGVYPPKGMFKLYQRINRMMNLKLWTIREIIVIYPQEKRFVERGHHLVLDSCVEEDSVVEAP